MTVATRGAEESDEKRREHDTTGKAGRLSRTSRRPLALGAGSRSQRCVSALITTLTSAGQLSQTKKTHTPAPPQSRALLTLLVAISVLLALLCRIQAKHSPPLYRQRRAEYQSTMPSTSRATSAFAANALLILVMASFGASSYVKVYARLLLIVTATQESGHMDVSEFWLTVRGKCEDANLPVLGLSEGDLVLVRDRTTRSEY